MKNLLKKLLDIIYYNKSQKITNIIFYAKYKYLCFYIIIIILVKFDN